MFWLHAPARTAVAQDAQSWRATAICRLWNELKLVERVERVTAVRLSGQEEWVIVGRRNHALRAREIGVANDIIKRTTGPQKTVGSKFERERHVHARAAVGAQRWYRIDVPINLTKLHTVTAGYVLNDASPRCRCSPDTQTAC